MSTLIWVLVPSLLLAQEAPDWPALLKQGETIIRRQPDIDPDLNKEVVLEQTVQERTVGYVRTLTRVREHEGRPVYQYVGEMIVEMPRTTVAGRFEVLADRRLRPVEMRMARKVKQADGSWFAQQRIYRFKEDSVQVQADIAGRKTEKVAPLPKEPFVFPVELLVQRAEPTKLETFAVREFNPDELKLELVQIQVTRESDGTITIKKLLENGKLDFTSRFDRENRQVEHSEAALPLVGRAVGRDKADELVRKFGRFETIESQPAP